MSTELIVQEFEPIVKQSGLEKAELYAAIFAPFMITLKELSDKAGAIKKDNPGPVDAKLAREVRLAMVKNRTATEKQKDLSKSTLLAESNLIQNLNNVVVNTSKLVEADLDAIEKFAENKEKERKALLATERAAMFVEYGTDLTGYDLGTMADNVFADLLESQKLLHEKRIADAAEAEAKRLAEQKAELERQAALRAENERLKKEADAAAKKLEEERAESARMAKIEADKQAALLRAEQDKAAAEKTEADKKAAQAAAELKAAKDAAAKAAKELQDKKDAEAKAEADRIAAEKKAAKAPVKEKLSVAVNSLSLDLPESEITADIMAEFNSFKSWALSQINTL